jgi:hypothetical protein
MKVTDLRRKLLAALAAAGLISPSAAYAANLDINLVANPGFENVDTNTHPPGTVSGDAAFLNPLILDWTGPRQGFAYSHNNTGGTFDYANGGPLAGGGNYYFTPNSVPNAFQPPGDIDAPGQVYQDIDVSTGATRTLIDTGNARYNVSAFFNTYLTDNDRGAVHLDFLNGSSVSVGTAQVAAQGPLDEWVPNAATGLIPSATRTVRVSIYGILNNAGPDGYMDNVDFRVSASVYQPTLSISVDRNSGTMSLSNLTGVPVNIKSYQIASAFEALDPANAKWISIAENYDAGSPGPNQVDAAHNWTELTVASANGDLSEADLESAMGASLPDDRVVNLGNAGAWISNPNEDLTFHYVSGTQLVRGIVTYTGNGGVALPLGDFNASGSITSADWIILRNNQHTNMSSLSLAEAYRLGDLTEDKLNNHADFVTFKTAYDAVNGAGAFVTMVASLPEPSTSILVLAAGAIVLPALRRRSNRH